MNKPAANPAAPYDQSSSPWGVDIPFADLLGIRLVEASTEHCIIAVDRRPELLNSWGSTHGGVIMTMLDLVMSIAVRAHYGVAAGVATIDMSVGFMRPSTGNLRAIGRAPARSLSLSCRRTATSAGSCWTTRSRPTCAGSSSVSASTRRRSTAFCEAEALDESGTLLAKAMGTFKRLNAKP